MNDFHINLKFRSSSESSLSDLKAAQMVLLNKPGIFELYIENRILIIGINTYEISIEELSAIMHERGLEPYPTKIKKGIIAKWIDHLAKNNKENFGDRRMDCCDLNN